MIFLLTGVSRTPPSNTKEGNASADFLIGVENEQTCQLAWIKTEALHVFVQLIRSFDGTEECFIPACPVALSELERGLHACGLDGVATNLLERRKDGYCRLRKPIPVRPDPTLSKCQGVGGLGANFPPTIPVHPADTEDYLNRIVAQMTRQGCNKREIGFVVVQHSYFEQTLRKAARWVRIRSRFNKDVHFEADVFQESWMRRAKWFSDGRPWTFNPAQGSFVPWLKQVLWSQAKRVRDEFAMGRLQLVEDLAKFAANSDGSVLDDLAEEEECHVLAQLTTLCQQLSPEHQDVLQMRMVENNSYKEIASKLKTTAGAARVRYHRAVRALRALINPKEVKG